jgi:hypothetical protein
MHMGTASTGRPAAPAPALKASRPRDDGQSTMRCTMPAIGGAAAVGVICLVKTGTLTRNETPVHAGGAGLPRPAFCTGG